MVIPILCIKLSISPEFSGDLTSTDLSCTTGMTLTTEVNKGLRIKLHTSTDYDLNRSTKVITQDGKPTISMNLERDF